MKKQEIIEMLELAMANSKCDSNGDWMNQEEQMAASIDATFLAQAIAMLQNVKNFQA